MAQKNNSRENARKFHAIHQRLDELEKENKWIKRELRKLYVETKAREASATRKAAERIPANRDAPTPRPLALNNRRQA